MSIEAGIGVEAQASADADGAAGEEILGWSHEVAVGESVDELAAGAPHEPVVAGGSRKNELDPPPRPAVIDSDEYPEFEKDERKSARV